MVAPHDNCKNEARIARNEKDIQTLFTEIGNMKNIRIANLTMQVATLLGVIASIAIPLLIK